MYWEFWVVLGLSPLITYLNCRLGKYGILAGEAAWNRFIRFRHGEKE
jgi:hypothetical protein